MEVAPIDYENFLEQFDVNKKNEFDLTELMKLLKNFDNMPLSPEVRKARALIKARIKLHQNRKPATFEF